MNSENLQYKLEQRDDYAIVHISFQDMLKPRELKTTHPPDAVKEGFAHKGVVLNGAMPLWLCGFLVHKYHPTKFVAIVDPRLKGAVVVESHVSALEVGDVISF
jgi:CRISPR-associated protein Csx3